MPEMTVDAEQPAANGSASGGGLSFRRIGVSLVVVAAIVAGIVLLNGAQDRPGASAAISVAGSGPAPRIGAVAPDFEAVDLNRKIVKLSDFRGKPVWINFWASWCPPCRAETPEVEAAYQEKQGDGVVLLGVSVGEEAAAVKPYVEQSGITYTVLLDPDETVAGRYRVNGLPTHLFVDRDGVVQVIQVGGMSKSAILKRLDGIMPRG